MALVTLDLAKDHLRIHPDDVSHDLEVSSKMEQATALVVAYLKRPNHGWTALTDPEADPEFALTQAAILEVLANVFNDHGDLSTPLPGPITERVKSLLSLIRDPTLA